MVQILKAKNISPDVIIEPTCGKGSILLEADKILSPKKSLGIEIQKEYADTLSTIAGKTTMVLHADIFTSSEAIKEFIGDEENLLFIGNPPWVTNSELSAHQSNNLPEKSNCDNFRGIEAITGKSNFDISEYIIQKLTDEFSHKKSVYAFLCKTSVAKKIMAKIWKQNRLYKSAELFPIDSKKYFNAAVDASFFILDFSEKNAATEMTAYDSIENGIPKCKSGWISGVYLEDVSKRDCLEIYGKSAFVWRNGIKHDCAKVMEFSVANGKPILLDDTCNFISFETKEEAEFILSLLNSPLVAEYLNARISWDSKRPVKTEILNSIDLFQVAEKLKQEKRYSSFFRNFEQLQLPFTSKSS